MKKIKLLSAAAAALLLLGTGIGSTFAYFSDEESLVNRIPIGADKTTITETFPDPEDKTAYTKVVQILNSGDTECYVRAYLNFSDYTVARASSVSWDYGTTYTAWDDLKTSPPDGWTYVPETESGLLGGYFYYTSPLKVSELTTPLLTNVKTEGLSESDLVYQVIVYEESVQTLNKDGAAFTGAEPWRSAWTEFLERR